MDDPESTHSHVPSVSSALRIIGNRISNGEFIAQTIGELRAGSNVEIIVQVHRRPEGDFRVTVKRVPYKVKEQLLCFTRLKG